MQDSANGFKQWYPSFRDSHVLCPAPTCNELIPTPPPTLYPFEFILFLGSPMRQSVQAQQPLLQSCLLHLLLLFALFHPLRRRFSLFSLASLRLLQHLFMKRRKGRVHLFERFRSCYKTKQLDRTLSLSLSLPNQNGEAGSCVVASGTYDGDVFWADTVGNKQTNK